MKKFIVDFEGEEDYTPAKPEPVSEGAPKYIIYWWNNKWQAEQDCKKLVGVGIPAWMIKYTFAEEGQDRSGWGTGVNTNTVGFNYDLQMLIFYSCTYRHIPFHMVLTCYDIIISNRAGLIMSRMCWKYEEIASKLKFFEAIPYEGESAEGLPI